jgi:hypothetical protein
MSRAFIVSSAEVFAHQTCSLRAIDYDNDAKRDSLTREAKKLRDRAASLTATADKLEAQASTLTPNRTNLTETP